MKKEKERPLNDPKQVIRASVVIPCYNLGEFLDEAVDSVLAQTYQDFEIIIVNDGSTDEATIKLLRDFNRPRTKVIHTENQGLSSARNNGIKASSGEYVCCLDADDKYFPEFLEKTVKVLDDDKSHKTGFVSTWVQVFGEETVLWKPFGFDPARLAFMNVGHVASLFRKECWDRVGGYSAEFRQGYEDWNFWLSITEAGYEWKCIEEPLFYYRKRANSMIKDADTKRVDNVKQLFGNHKAFYINNAETILLKFMEVQEDCIKENAEANLKLVEKDRLLAQQDGQLAGKDVQIAEQRAENKRQLLEFNRQLAEQERLFTEQERLFAESRAGFERQLADKDRIFAEQERLLAEKNLQMAEQRAEYGRDIIDKFRQMAELRADYDSQIEEMNRRMTVLCAEHEKQISGRDRQLSELDRLRAERDLQMAELRIEQGRQIALKDQQIAEWNQRMDVVLQSLSWRMTVPVRKLMGIFMAKSH